MVVVGSNHTVLLGDVELDTAGGTWAVVEGAGTK